MQPKYKEIFKSDEVHDSRNPEFTTSFLVDVPVNGDRALRADVYISHPAHGKDIEFGSAIFSMSEILQETTREMSVRIKSPLTNNTILHVRYEEGHNTYEPKIAECWGLMASTYIYRGEPETRTRVLCREECWETKKSKLGLLVGLGGIIQSASNSSNKDELSSF